MGGRSGVSGWLPRRPSRSVRGPGEATLFGASGFGVVVTMKEDAMHRYTRPVALLVAAAALTLLAPAASAAPGGTGHTVTMTEITHGVFDAGIEGPNPCSGADIVSVNASGTVVNHVTFFPAGDEVWATFTETGKITIVDSNGVTYTGRLTDWGNFNLNEKNTNFSFTLTITLRGSDGSTITAHEVQHFAQSANGVVTVDFDTMRFTCG